MALKAGDRLGPYEIVAPLGAGGMGEVYRARDTRLDRTVALKVLLPSLAADQQFRERFEREARTISALDHPHICALYDVGEKDGTSFLVMQYLEGETLADRLRRARCRSIRDSSMRCCLAKDAEDRWQSARDVKLQLAGIVASPARSDVPQVRTMRSRERMAWAVLALALLGFAVAAGMQGWRRAYVQSFPTMTGKWQVSTDGGTQPRWRRDGKELVYLARDRRLMAVAIKASGTFEADTPRPLFETRLDVGALRHTYAMSADGKRFLLNTPIETSAPPLTVVLNWPALLKQ
jgi:hypothetical protein